MQAPMIARRLAEKHGPVEAARKAKAREQLHGLTYRATDSLRSASRVIVWGVVLAYITRKYGVAS